MVLAIEILFLLLLAAVCGFAPGFYLVRRLPWRPMEKLCGSVGLSLALLYLAAWTIYCYSPADGRIHAAPYAGVSIICVGLAAAARRDAVRLFRSTRVRRALLAYGFLLAWTLVMLAIIRNYSGGAWRSDWLEHFQRTLYFVYHFPSGTPILGNYELPARPPMMNVVAGFFLAQTGDRFENFQVVFAILNLLPFLACCQLLPRLAAAAGARRRSRILPLVVLFAFNPAVMEAATYTWTKAFAAFYILLAMHFYLAGWQRRDGGRMLAAFLALSAGMLVHYSAGPYLVFFGLHFLLQVFWKRPRRWREALVLGVVCGAFLATWFGWSIRTFGVRATFASNTSVTSSQQYAGHNLEKIIGNLFDTVVPLELRDAGLLAAFDQPNTLGKVRDVFFVSYQSNLLLTMGICGGVAALWLYAGALSRGRAAKPYGRFWLALVPFCVLLGIASTGERDYFGLAHLTLLPIAMLGITLVAGAVPRSRALAVAVLCGCVIDFGAGVGLHAYIEGLDNTPSQTVFQGLVFRGAGAAIGTPSEDSLSGTAWTNWLQKHQYALVRQWLPAMEQRGHADPGFAARARGVTARLAGWLDEDRRLWHGWYARHGGSVTFLGDHVAGASGGGTVAAEGLLLVAMLGLAGLYAREIPKPHAEPVAERLAPPPLAARTRGRPGSKRRAAGRRG